jgi:hypothetical protein
MAHRPRGAGESTQVTIEAPTSWAAIETLRAKIPADHLVLYVRAIN